MVLERSFDRRFCDSKAHSMILARHRAGRNYTLIVSQHWTTALKAFQVLITSSGMAMTPACCGAAALSNTEDDLRTPNLCG
jgi:hypothetical protein